MRIISALAAVAAVTATLSLGGCSLFGSDDDEKAAADQAAAQAAFAPIASVRHIEIGRTRNGYVITAHGIAPGLGYGSPELRVRRQWNAGPDGIIDFDFVARAPDPGFNLGVGAVEARAIRADLLVTGDQFRGASGIRIHGVSGGLQMKF